MAIDSAAKRLSMLFFVGHRKGRLIPDGIIASPDFQDLLGFYRGIQAAAPAEDIFILLHTTTATRRTHATTATQRTHATTASRRTHDITINEP